MSIFNKEGGNNFVIILVLFTYSFNIQNQIFAIVEINRMDFSAYKKIVKQITVGKKLPDAIYLHESAFEYVPDALKVLLEQFIQEYSLVNFYFNIIKFHTRDFKISLLNYSTFFEEAYPPLAQSCSIDLILKKYRISRYNNSQNPPI